MGRRGNQTFLKNQKAQKRVARANAKRAEKQARRDEKIARANAGDVTSGPPIEWNESGETSGVEGSPSAEDAEDGERDDRGADDGTEAATKEPVHSTER
jgi:hypothetical protein